MENKNYQAPLSEEILLRTEGIVCASDLPTDSLQGLEGWTTDTEGSWD